MKHKSTRIHKGLLIAKRSFQVLLTALIIVFAFPTKSSFKYEFTKGQFWKHENLISPMDFAIKKTEKEIRQEETKSCFSRKIKPLKQLLWKNSEMQTPRKRIPEA